MAYIQLMGTRNELAAIPEGRCGFQSEQIRCGGDGEHHPSAKRIPEFEFFHCFYYCLYYNFQFCPIFGTTSSNFQLSLSAAFLPPSTPQSYSAAVLQRSGLTAKRSYSEAVLQRSGLTAKRSYSAAVLQRSGHAVKSAHSPKFAAKLQHFFENKKSKAKTKSFCNKKCSFYKKNARALAYVKKKSYLCRLFLCNAQVTIVRKTKININNHD